jgi:hypothetical protein
MRGTDEPGPQAAGFDAARRRRLLACGDASPAFARVHFTVRDRMNERASAAPSHAAIDFSLPWFDPVCDVVPLLSSPDPRAALTAAARLRGVRTASGRPVQFVGPDDAGATAYEAHIHATGRVPTRDNLHDRFNALMWLAFPLTKAALNARQADAIARDGLGGRRGPVRDAATLIDESGLIVVSADPRVFEALAAHDWRRLLIDGRARWGGAIVALAFGHALLEKLAGPFKAITAAVVPVARPPGSRAGIDAAAAQFVHRADLAPRLLAHLPVLGIPGWWPANEDPRFYDDPAVFRPPRRDRTC